MIILCLFFISVLDCARTLFLIFVKHKTYTYFTLNDDQSVH